MTRDVLEELANSDSSLFTNIHLSFCLQPSKLFQSVTLISVWKVANSNLIGALAVFTGGHYSFSQYLQANSRIRSRPFPFNNMFI
jgi:hypothetical protein